MLISALCSYYDFLEDAGKVLPPGYSNAKIHYSVALSPEGKIVEITDVQSYVPQQKGKGKPKITAVPKNVRLPLRTEKPGIDANIAEHRPLYLFGLNLTEEGLSPDDATNKAKKSHAAFVEKQLAFLEGLHSDVIDAYRNFVTGWVPEEEAENPHLLALKKGYGTSGFTFHAADRLDLPLYEDPLLLAAWEKAFAAESGEDTCEAQCAVTGEMAPIARIHDKIKVGPGGLATGNVLVGFNSTAEESYGKSQSYNSNISVGAMKRYTEALNCLLADRNHRANLDDVIMVHWAMSSDERYDRLVEEGVIHGFDSDDEDKMGVSETEDMLRNLMKDAAEGKLLEGNLAIEGMLDPRVEFYMVGFKPNSARLAIKFIYRTQFGKLLQNIVQHQMDIRMKEGAAPVPLWRIRKELIKPHSKNDTVDPALMSKLLESIFYGYRYPEWLLSTVIRRIKNDSDEENNSFIKLNPVRAGIIKGCLNRKSRLSGKKEEFSMGLDKDNTNPAYLCGRLFAILEKLQQDASGNSLNRTIKDAYFASACSQPAVVFPKLMRLAQNHLSKATNGKQWNDMIGEITEKMGGAFPPVLPLVDQGKFILGYYHQFFSKNENKNKSDETVQEG